MLDPYTMSYIVLELLIAVFSVLGNVLVCWAVCLNSNLQTITNFFVVSLAVADIAVGVLAIPFSIAISTGFCSNFYGCLFIACFVLVLTQSSIFSLLAIAIDRYIAIKLPLRYNSLVTGKRAQGIIAICWVLSIAIGLTPMMGWHVKPEPSQDCSPGLVKCLFEEVVLMSYMVYFNFFGCVLIPLLLMLGIYLCIFMAARHQLRLIQLKVVHGERSGSTLQKEVQAAKSLAIIVGLFAVCWLPLHIINCFTYFCPKCYRPPMLIMYTAIILSHGNSVVNPFIYAYRIREFRQTFRKIIRRHILGRRPQLESSGSRRTSIHNSVTDSIRRNTNGLRMDLFNEHSSSSCEISYHCPTEISMRGGLIAVSHAPLSIIIAHCPHVTSCPLQALKQSETSTLANEQHVEGQQSSSPPENTMDKQDIGSAQASGYGHTQRMSGRIVCTPA
ncbi:adenosine A2a receptor a isoform X2 [Takifugu rubripes]|uniref:Adenosine receptor A2 n=1 Tax=Takifugu rubripes TaxID=31033 RepID=A0A674MC46_TAKRU|nr:adenosine receptor A2a isoform X2 [Takifugu rubripes]|eukprot:XP_011613748.1 PREDICTED: adenosine receptor A2b-like isoform X2 [Takifugu rubripes]